MGDVINVLLTGAGAPGTAGTIWSLINNEDMQNFYIVGCDINPNAVGCELCDSFFTVPSPFDPAYEHIIRALVKEYNIDVIIPQTTDEVRKLCTMHHSFFPTKILCSLGNATALVNNKWSLVKAAKSLNIPVPISISVSSYNALRDACHSLGYPNKDVVIKPCVGNGSRGVRIITETKSSMREFLSTKPDGIRCSLADIEAILKDKQFEKSLLVQQYLPGPEYTVDVYQDEESIVTIPRRRDKIVNGISFENTVDMMKQDIIRYSTILAQNISGLQYCFGFQFKLSSEGVAKLLECNPRVQGTMVVSALAGYNMIYNSVLSALGKDVSKAFSIVDGMKFKRVWGGVCINAENNYVRF